MKKYEKPQVYIEKFELSQHIAACAWDMSNSTTVDQCSAESDPGFNLPPGLHAFNTNVVTCTDGPLEDICYTNGGEGHNIFNS